MNIHQSLSHFGYQDFLLVEAPLETVVLGLFRQLKLNEQSNDIFSGGRKGEPFWKRLVTTGVQIVAEINGLDDDENQADRRYRLHRGPDAEGNPITNKCVATTGKSPDQYFPGWDDIRVSTVQGRPNSSIVEFRDETPGEGKLAFELSKRLPGQDVLLFRRSGPLATRQQHDFHVWHDGAQTRRVSCHEVVDVDQNQSLWACAVEGSRSKHEPGAIYVGVSDPSETLNAYKLDQILASFETSVDHLFGRNGRNNSVLFSRGSWGGELL